MSNDNDENRNISYSKVLDPSRVYVLLRTCISIYTPIYIYIYICIHALLLLLLLLLLYTRTTTTTATTTTLYTHYYYYCYYYYYYIQRCRFWLILLRTAFDVFVCRDTAETKTWKAAWNPLHFLT
jgi:hypothetical protein